jgi:predicted nucleotidyltransferase
MRLIKKELEIIKTVIAKHDKSARIHLFGSRVSDSKRGGDIDLLVFSDKLKYDENLRIKIELKELLGDQKIDLVVAKDKSNPFIDLVYDSSERIQ